ncbi:hypothetical protein ACP70R_043368 [Stipagrostis hirtigluma subsp. patula]
MAGPAVRSPLSILFYVLAAAATQAASMTADEEYWAKRAQISGSYNRAAYVSDPISSLNNFNTDVKNGTEAATRRSLKSKYKGPCKATNPIDQCWRCHADWAANRKQLAKCAMGFGHKATGGVAGQLYVVIDASDDNMVLPKFGTLRYAAIQSVPLWITFARDMIIRLKQELIVTSDTTIDGRGAQVHITGAQITVQAVNNVIIHNLHIHDSVPQKGGLIRDSTLHCGVRGESDGDGISVISASNIWIDHVSMHHCADGLIDVGDGSTAITISNGHFTKHDHVMLFGGDDHLVKDRIMQVTVAFNHFGKGLVQRMPRIRFGFVHIVNNDYTHWMMYAIGGNQNPTIISQGNRYRALDDRNYKEVTKREYVTYEQSKEWVWKSQDDLFLNGAFFNQSGGQNERNYDVADMIEAKSGEHVSALTQFAGALKCREGKVC